MVAPTSRVFEDRNKISFAVDSVKLGVDRFPRVSLWTRVERMTERSLRVTSHPSHFRIVEDDGCHALLSAVHLAFSRHLPLALSPVVIWLTIAQGFSQHVSNHSEDLRPLLVRHQGKMLLRAKEPEDWADAANQWTQQIASHIAPDLHDTLLCDFSTTTPVIRIASQVVMMEAFQRYFDYAVYCICGIPTITLYGTVEDWRTIRERVKRLAPYELSWWTDRLLPLCDAFIATAEGYPPIDFWKQIYKPKEAYGGDTITGWIADLFPYLLNGQEKPVIENPLLRIPRSQLTAEDGLRLRRFPNGLSSVPVSLELAGAAPAIIPLEFLGGFFGVTQDSLSGCLQAEIGWGVQERSALTDILEKLAREHTLNPPRYAPGFEQLGDESIPAEIVEMMSHCDGGKLFAETDHPWRLLRSSSFTLHNDSGDSYVRFADLADGRSIGFTRVYFWGRTGDRLRLLKSEHWIVLGRLKPDPANASQQSMPKEKTVVIAMSLPQFFERMLQAEGHYYFDSPDFIPDEHWAASNVERSRRDDAPIQEVIPEEEAVPSATAAAPRTVPKLLVLFALLLVLSLAFGVYHRQTHRPGRSADGSGKAVKER